MNMQHLSALLCFFWSSLYDIYGMVCLVAFPWNTCGMATNQNASQPKTRYCPASEQNTLDQFQIYSTINYDPALKFTTRITFLTSIPPAECYGRDPEVYSVYLHVEPCRAMSSHVEPCRAMSSHVEPRAATEVEIKILEMPSLKSCKVKSRSCWSCQQGDRHIDPTRTVSRKDSRTT